MAEDKTRLYFIAVVPNEQIQDEVTQFKLHIAEQYKSKHSLKSPPHITLHMPFRWKEEKESQLVSFLEKFSEGKTPFELSLKNFSSFPKRVIYIDVEKNDQLYQLFKELATNIRKELKIISDTYKNQGFTAHMTVAHRDLRSAAYDQAWAEFKEKAYNKKFTVDHICLLKHNGTSWDIFGRFMLS